MASSLGPRGLVEDSMASPGRVQGQGQGLLSAADARRTASLCSSQEAGTATPVAPGCLAGDRAPLPRGPHWRGGLREKPEESPSPEGGGRLETRPQRESQPDRHVHPGSGSWVTPGSSTPGSPRGPAHRGHPGVQHTCDHQDRGTAGGTSPREPLRRLRGAEAPASASRQGG